MITTTFSALGSIYDGPHATPTRLDEGPYFLNIASLQNGRLDLAQSDHLSGDDFVRWTRRVTPRGGDLLFSYETRLGSAALMPDGVDACLGRRMALLRPHRGVIDPRYLLFRYLAPDFQETIRSNAIHGATVDRIPLTSMGAWPIQVHPLEEQRAIAEVLGALDDAIAANDRVIAQAERLAVALASRGALTVPLAQISEHSRVTTNPGVMGDAIVDHYSLPAYDTAKMPERSHATSILSGKFRIVQPSVLISKLNPRFPRVWDVPTVNNCSVSSTEFIILEPKSVSTSVLWALLSQPSVSDYLCERAAGTSGSHQRVKPHDLLTMPVGDPASLEIQAQDRITGICASVYAKRRQNQALAALRDALLPELMSGRMRVKDAQQRVEEAI